METPQLWVTYTREVNVKLNPHIKGGNIRVYIGTDTEGLKTLKSSERIRIVSVYKGTIGDLFMARHFIDVEGESPRYDEFLSTLERVQ